MTGGVAMKLLQFPDDIESYITGKERLVLEIEQLALKWYKDQQK